MEKKNALKHNSIDRQYKELLEHILHFGVEKKDRTGTGTKSIFGWQIRHNMKEGFPLLTTKKMHWKSIVTELLWFLRGDTNIKYLVDNDCHIWDGDAYKNYMKVEGKKFHENTKELRKWATVEGPFGPGGLLKKEEFINKIKTDSEFAKKWGELGPIYGKQWRSWEHYEEIGQHYSSQTQKIEQSDILRRAPIDQIANSINLLKTDPDSRRNKVSAWNVGELDQMVLPPCHTDFQFYTRELSERERIEMIQPFGMDALAPEVREKWMKENNVPTRAISLIFNMRSCDTFLGLPFNIASYALLLEIIAKEVNMVPDELIGNLGDTHLYLNHIEQAKEQITRTPYELPKLKIDDWYSTQGAAFNDAKLIIQMLNSIDPFRFIIENYQSHPAIKAPLSN